MSGRRKALIVANDQYDNDELRRLISPEADAEALNTVLADPRIGGFEVQVVRNEPMHVIGAHIEDLLSEARPDDVLLVHFSCHGLKSESGDLFFAARNTRPNRLGSTALSADFVQRCMRASRSRSIVLLLDCCYGGAFNQGVRVRDAGGVDVLASFPAGKLGGGRGRAVITASSAMEYAFEGERLTEDQNRRPSVFTSALVEGLATGDADRDQDGWVSLNELYEYVFDRVREQNPNQTPGRDVEMQGELYVARRRYPVTTPAPLPPELEEVIEHPLANVRAGAVEELARLGRGKHAGLAIAAKLALERLADDDSRTVSTAAAAALGVVDVARIVQPADGLRPTPELQKAPDLGEQWRSIDTTGGPAAAPPQALPATPSCGSKVDGVSDEQQASLADARRSGYRDGSRAAQAIPLYALEGLLLTGFDIVRWLEPWRESWRLIVVGQAPPDTNLLQWLPPLAQSLGPYAAPDQLIQVSVTPSPGYVGGFVDAFSDAWRAAVKDRLLPNDPATLSAWLREPTHAGAPSNKPRFLQTIGDLRGSARRGRRITAWKLAGRIAMWALASFFALMEVAAIGVTVSGGWEASQPATNPIIANLCFAIPFLAMTTWAYFDLQRHRRRRRVNATTGRAIQSPDEPSP